MIKRKIVLLGKNGAGKTRYISKLFDNQQFNNHFLKKPFENSEHDLFGGIKTNKGEGLYMHAISLQTKLTNPQVEHFTKMLSSHTKYELNKIFVSNSYKMHDQVVSNFLIYVEGIVNAKGEQIYNRINSKYGQPYNFSSFGYNTPEEYNEAKKSEFNQEKNEMSKRIKTATLSELEPQNISISLEDIFREITAFLPPENHDEFIECVVEYYQDITFETIKDMEPLSDRIFSSLVKDLINKKKLSISESLSALKEIFARETIIRSINKSNVNDYDESFLESEIIDRFNVLSIQSALGIVLKPENINQQLTIKYMKDDQEVNFEFLSTGQKVLLNIISNIVQMEMKQSSQLSILVLEEFDAFLNPENVKQLIPLISNLDVDIILTSHSPLTVHLLKESPHTEYWWIEKGEDPNPIEKKEAISNLLSSVKNISIDTYDHKIIFVEDKNDIEFFNTMYRNMTEGDVMFEKVPVFQSISMSNTSPGNGGVDKINTLYKTLKEGKIEKHFSFIRDYDNDDTFIENININGKRYSAENYLFDYYILKIIFKNDDKRMEQIEKFAKQFESDEKVKTRCIIDGEEISYEISKEFYSKKQKDAVNKLKESNLFDTRKIMAMIKEHKVYFPHMIELFQNILLKGSSK